MFLQNGIVLMVLAMSLTPALDGVAKEMGSTHEPLVIVFLRYFTAGILACVIAVIFRIPLRFNLVDLPGHLLRTGLMMGAMGAFIAALTHIPMAEAVGGFLTAPLVSTVLAIVFLKERLTVSRGVGVALGCVGACLIANPGVSLSLGTVYALVGGVLLGGYMTASRCAVVKGDGPVATLAIQCLLGSAMVAPFALQQGFPEVSVSLGAGALALGVLSASCHFLTLAALRRAETTVLAPFMYFNVIVSVVVGFVFFNEVPESRVILGLAAVSAGGLVSSQPGISAAFGRWFAAFAESMLAQAKHYSQLPIILPNFDDCVVESRLPRV